MESEFDAQSIHFETVRLERDLPFRCFFNSVNYVGSHWHAELELLLQVRGVIAISMPSGATRLERGDLFLANPFQVHSIVRQSEDPLTLALQIDLTDPLLLPRSTGRRRFLPAASWDSFTQSQVRRSLVRIARELADMREASPLVCLSSITGTLAALVRNAGDPTASESYAPAAPADGERPVWFDRVRAIISYLQERYDHPISLDDVAIHVGLSRYYVSHLVKEATGLSLQENLGLIRTNRAIHLMFTTQERLVDVALDAGFSHLKYFTKYFRRLYGSSPSEVRESKEWRNSVLEAGSGTACPPTRELVAHLADVE
jgi:AraC-like DNA-binding protein